MRQPSPKAAHNWKSVVSNSFIRLRVLSMWVETATFTGTSSLVSWSTFVENGMGLRAGPNPVSFEYIEIYYNCQRKHSAIGYQVPLVFEKTPYPCVHFCGAGTLCNKSGKAYVAVSLGIIPNDITWQ